MSDKEKPYLKQLETVDDFEVREVDGEYIRNNIDREFTNFGQHFRFKFIPKMEFWVDRQYTPGEEKYFITHLLKEWFLMSTGVPYNRALERADLAEKHARAKSDFMTKIKKEVAKFPTELHKQLLHEYGDTVKVWVVNGEVVRDLYFIDFTEGGHHYVYHFVPLGEVWIDDDLLPEERPFVILHELHERYLMSQGMNYHKAHLSSSIIEYKCRRDPTNLATAMQEEIKKNLQIDVKSS